MTIGSDNSGVMMGPHNTLLILAGAVHICKEYSQKMLIFTKVLIATVTWVLHSKLLSKLL